MLEEVRIRPVELSDVDAIIALEAKSFEWDRMSRRSIRRFIQQGQHCFLCATIGEAFAGYILVFLHRGTKLARLYSIATDPDFRGKGVARALIHRAEKLAAESGRITMRLEVRTDNVGAIRLYESLGYRKFGSYEDYYEDHADALRLQKRIVHLDSSVSSMVEVPYYSQTTDFTCGPASLMMAMRAHRKRGLPAPSLPLIRAPQEKLQDAVQPFSMTQTEELRIWREATTVYLLSGHGGCSPVGLALAAIRRGFPAEVYLSSTETPFIDTVRDHAKKDIIETVHGDFLGQLADFAAPVHYETITQTIIDATLVSGGIPIVLISTYQFDSCKVPHWVVVTASDERFIYIHDPQVDEDNERFEIDNQYLPIGRDEFDRMAQYGRTRLRTAVIVWPEPVTA